MTPTQPQAAQHTKGPWQVMNSPKAGHVDIWSLGDDEPQNRKVVASIEPSNTTHTDAALIAAAPTLYNFIAKQARKGHTEAKATLDSLLLPY